MPRRPLDYLTALATLLLAVWLFLCLLSWMVPAGGDMRRGGGWHGFALRDGELLVWSHVPATPENKKAFPHAVLKPEWNLAGASVRSGARPSARVGWEVTIPFWLATAVVGFLPVYRFAMWQWQAARGRARADRSLCPACGYDLQGCLSPICPECGTAKWRGGAPVPLRTGTGSRRT